MTDTVTIIVPATENDDVANGLRALTEAIARAGLAETHAGLFGGTFGYGVAFENDVFMMHPFCCYRWDRIAAIRAALRTAVMDLVEKGFRLCLCFEATLPPVDAVVVPARRPRAALNARVNHRSQPAASHQAQSGSGAATIACARAAS